MKSYLQRLALGVMQPTRTIHPMVGSVFSPSEYASARPAAPQEQTTLFSSRPSPGFVEGRERAGDISPNAQHQSHVSTQEPSGVHDPQPVYKPLMPEVTDRQAGNRTQLTTQQTENSFSVREEKISSSFPASDTGEKSPREAETQQEEKTQEITVKHVYMPIMSESLARAANQEMPGQNVNPFAAAARERAQAAARHTAPVSREPDEIQIHIGRIEVTAVQQTSVPPATKPVRKGLNLEEYLRRSDRRV